MVHLLSQIENDLASIFAQPVEALAKRCSFFLVPRNQRLRKMYEFPQEDEGT